VQKQDSENPQVSMVESPLNKQPPNPNKHPKQNEHHQPIDEFVAGDKRNEKWTCKTLEWYSQQQTMTDELSLPSWPDVPGRFLDLQSRIIPMLRMPANS
jgi:hypothetical protein